MVTHLEIFTQIMSEVTCKPRSLVEMSLRSFVGHGPLLEKLEKTVSNEEAEAILAELRKEKAGILNWILEGVKKRKAIDSNAN